jgi:hypothetical protein
MIEQPAPIVLRYVDLALPGGATVQLTLYPTDTVETLTDPPRLVVQFREQSDETFTAYLGPGVTVREAVAVQRPIPLDESGRPRQFQTIDEYRAYMAALASA